MRDEKFEQIDALRFFAVLPVLTSHWGLFNISESSQFLLASNGVNLFFAISGFLITLGLIRSKDKDQSFQTSLWKFYVRRFLRIFPIYYLMLILLWFFNHKKVAEGIWWYLTYSSNFYNIKIEGWGGLPHLWSLALEEQFYLIWPFLILFIPNRLLPSLIGLTITLSIFFKAYCINSNATFWVSYMNPIAVLDILGLGALLAFYHHFEKAKTQALLFDKRMIAFVIFQFLLILYFRYTDKYKFIYLSLYRASFGLLSIWLIGRAAFAFTGFIGNVFNFGPIRYMGKISYGVYLFHILVPGMLMGLKYPTGQVGRFIMYFIVTIVISSISWHYFESKFLKIKDKFY